MIIPLVASIITTVFRVIAVVVVLSHFAVILGLEHIRKIRGDGRDFPGIAQHLQNLRVLAAHEGEPWDAIEVDDTVQ